MTVIIKPGSSSLSIAKQFVSDGILKSPWFFLGAQNLHYPRKKLKAGEYLIPKSASILDIIDQMEAGRTVVRKLTIPEGLTAHQIMNRIKNTHSLSGQIVRLPAEGMLLPETYTYSYGDDRQKLVDRMEKAMSDLLKRLWFNRKIDDSLIETPELALNLASIVEKETGLPSERRRVAAVFLNRLEIGMPLQADPTVIYAITEGRGELDRDLTRKDLKIQSPFNTYVVKGLPPCPIACPGRASIEAVLSPADTDDLYFVADGTGGHAFSANLADHNRRVSEWRKVTGHRPTRGGL